MILLLRGHIRNSFDNRALYLLVKQIVERFDAKIYIHTWNVVQTKCSWRPMNDRLDNVDENTIYNYFADISQNIHRILIDDDTNISVLGKTSGFISNSRIPTIGWKRMWYGKYRAMEAVQETSDPNDIVVNMRFDVQSNSNNLSPMRILQFINQYKQLSKPTNVFITGEKPGVDNIYIGKVEYMYELISHFYHNLDQIVTKYPLLKNQEFLVIRENDALYRKYIEMSQLRTKPNLFAKSMPPTAKHNITRYIHRYIPIVSIKSKPNPNIKPTSKHSHVYNMLFIK